MTLRRRQFLHLASGVVALPVLSQVARAQGYPSRLVRVIVGYPPGGSVDTLSRVMGQWLSEHLGQSFVIENRQGGGGNIATEAAVRAPADGYTLLVVGPTQAMNVTLYDKLSFNFIRDITPVGGITRTSLVVAVNPSFPAKTVPEFAGTLAERPSSPARTWSTFDNPRGAGSSRPLHLCPHPPRLELLGVPSQGHCQNRQNLPVYLLGGLCQFCRFVGYAFLFGSGR
jgi:tripartite-type tricarboxylate transporter receptor subunit TctC